jgi:hypothetical protein
MLNNERKLEQRDAEIDVKHGILASGHAKGWQLSKLNELTCATRKYFLFNVDVNWTVLHRFTLIPAINFIHSCAPETEVISRNRTFQFWSRCNDLRMMSLKVVISFNCFFIRSDFLRMKKGKNSR